MGYYIYAPVGAFREKTNVLVKCVEFIGSRQDGIGSDYAKGKRYLKRKIPNCSSRAIRRTVKICEKVYNHDYEKYGLDVYYFHKELCARIVEEILDYMIRQDTQTKINIFGRDINKSETINIMCDHRIDQLEWVANTDYKEQGEAAGNISYDLKNLYY